MTRKRKVSDAQVREIRAALLRRESFAALARQYGVSDTLVRMIGFGRYRSNASLKP